MCAVALKPTKENFNRIELIQVHVFHALICYKINAKATTKEPDESNGRILRNVEEN